MFVLWISGDGIVVLDEVGCVRPMYVCLFVVLWLCVRVVFCQGIRVEVV